MWVIGNGTAFNLDRADFIAVREKDIVAYYGDTQKVIGTHETHEQAKLTLEQMFNGFAVGGKICFVREV